MGLFKSKEEKRREEKLLVMKAMGSMKKQIEALALSKERYTLAAIRAKKYGILSQYNLAKSGIKIVQAQKSVVEQMLLNLEMTAQAKDAGEISCDFMDGMQLLTGEIIKTSNALDFTKVERNLSGAFASSEINIERMGETLDLAGEGYASLNSAGTDDIDALVDERLAMEESEISSDGLLQERIDKLKKGI